MRTGTDLLISVRPLERSDREPIGKLLRETGVFSDEETDVALELIDTALNTRGQKDYIIYTGVGENGDVAGYYCVGPTPMTASTWDLYWIAVSPSFQGRDFGRTLLEHAEELVVSRGGKLLIAETSSKPSYDATNRFYRNNGYLELSRIRNYYREGDDLVVYGKYFSH